MPSKIFSAALTGLDARLIEVEVEISYGLPSFTIVGLPDKAVAEAKDRVGAAIKNSGFQPPSKKPSRVLVNLAPADLKKEGALYDLAIAIGYLVADKQIHLDLNKRLVLGELALDGSLRPIVGGLAFSLLAKEKGFHELVLPKDSAQEAALIEDTRVIGGESLRGIIDHLSGKSLIAPTAAKPRTGGSISTAIEIGLIKGQEYAKRALEITAAGGHNILMQGPPGTGKTLLAQALPSILPPLNMDESLEVTKIYSAAGLLPSEKPLMEERPFRSPHHNASEVALIGGGNPPRPGEITLAHRGVMFMDEFPEFHRDVLESLRQPMEEGKISLLRSKHRLSLPAKFMLVAAANPCPCGYYGNQKIECRCQPSQIAKYRRKLSGPLIDRFDIFIDVPQIKYEKLEEPDTENMSSTIRARVVAARDIQQERFKNEDALTNSEMNLRQIKKYCAIDGPTKNLVRKFVDSGRLSVRGYHRVLKIARTIADLDSSQNILLTHLGEALAYRSQNEI